MGEPLRALLEEGVVRGVFPGAQVAVRAPGVRLDLTAGVTQTVGPGRAVHGETIFDVASLTKALCTSVLLMQAVDAGAVSLDAPVGRWFPALPGSAVMTVGQLAAHRGGLAPHRPFFEVLRREGVTLPSEARRRMRALIEAEPPVAAPGSSTHYSDLGYLVLGWLLEEVLGAPLDRLFSERVARPLALEHTSFGPVAGEDVAATELDEAGEPLRGVVHDENARAIGGVAGHAGLFSTALDVAAVVGDLAAAYGGAVGGLAAPETVRRFWQTPKHGSFALGWDTPTEPSSSGRYTTRGASVGHLGFTGCSVWRDLARGVTVVLLSNRVHPTRDNEAIRAFRPAFHDAVNAWLAS